METLTTVSVHGNQYKVKHVLGEGCSTTAYALRGGKVLCVTRNDQSKDILFALQSAKNPHIPKMRKVSSEPSRRSTAYCMLRYKTFEEWHNEDLEPAAMEAGDAINEAYLDFRLNWMPPERNMTRNAKLLYFVEYLRKIETIPQSVVDALKLIIDTATRLGINEMCIDMHNGNLATTLDGQTLVFLDPFVA